MVRVTLAGATGWAGSALARGIAMTNDIKLVSAVSRRGAGRTLDELLQEKSLDCPVYGSAK